MEIHGDLAAPDQINAHVHPSVRLVNGAPSYLHRDQLGSVVRITGVDGADDTRRSYRVFGEIAT